jgi:hypothetical protein
MRVWLLAGLLALGIEGALPAQTQPLLQLQGQPYFGGSMTLHLSGTVGQPALLAYGLNPLPLAQPLQTGKGPWYIGSLVNVVPIGTIPSGGRIDLPFTMPPLMPPLAGLPIAMQGYVPSQLSNPAVLRLDVPYFTSVAANLIPSPEPSVSAGFGDRVSIGDLNGDTFNDLVVGAPLEDYAGMTNSGRVYVHWGPDFSTYVALSSSPVIQSGAFGASIQLADVDGDHVDDLIVAESSGYPAIPAGPGYLHVYLGGSPFASVPAFSIASNVVGTFAVNFGRRIVLGDFNDDVSTDIAVGIETVTVGGTTTAGRVDVYWGPGYATHLEIANPTPTQGDFFGSYLSSGDVNGDGLMDLIEGSGRDDHAGSVNQGSIHVFLSPALAYDGEINYPLPSAPQARFGEDVHAADLDGDGTAEIVTADDHDHVFVLGPLAPLSFRVVSKPPTPTANPFGETSYGGHISTADVNGDGCLDILIGDLFEGTLVGCLGGNSGTVYAALGPHYSTFALIRDVIPMCGDGFGDYFMIGNADGDEPLELIVGSATADDGGLQNSGHVTLFQGN